MLLKKKFIIAFLSLAAIAVIAVVVLTLTSETSEEEMLDDTDTVVETEEPTNDELSSFDMPVITYSEDVEEIEEPDSTGDDIAPLTPEEEAQSKSVSPAIHDRFQDHAWQGDRTTAGTGGYTASEENLLTSIDSQRFMDTACDFVRKFYTYDPETLRSGAYKRSWSGMLLYDPSLASDLLKTRNNDKWAANSSTYPEVFSEVFNVRADTPQISKLTHEGHITVYTTAEIRYNQSMPSSGDPDWADRHTYKVYNAVYFNQQGQVVDITQQRTTFIE